MRYISHFTLGLRVALQGIQQDWRAKWDWVGREIIRTPGPLNRLLPAAERKVGGGFRISSPHAEPTTLNPLFIYAGSGTPDSQTTGVR